VKKRTLTLTRDAHVDFTREIVVKDEDEDEGEDGDEDEDRASMMIDDDEEKKERKNRRKKLSINLLNPHGAKNDQSFRYT